ncbi:Cof-type HAD-IIB family hydrolase [Lacticaseibacillus yichunensis]|uniref:Cof-type HAD-IIB family hydrolase n=1 Tax=Lacticaseibacillus yichunensis TaxID=2486015 RepID=A0ABW4CQ91_9LACO|nr:Cof-type HAD-IIB family hydrolase [Lacticaseibacillus yichunensis]
MIKLIAVDMDGTFLNSAQDYDRKRFAAVHKLLTERGIQFVVASGNQYYQLRSFFKDYAETIYVAENGAYIRGAKQTYATHTFSPEATDQITEFLSSDPALSVIACGVGSAYVRALEGPEYIAQTRRFYHRLEVRDDLTIYGDPIMKFGVNMAPSRTQEYLVRFTEAFAGIAEVTSSGHGDIDIIQPGRHKAAGLKELGARLGISLADMAAFGDGGNDLEMIREVGLGVAMKNASPAVLEAADVITEKTNDEAGVCDFLEGYFSPR